MESIVGIGIDICPIDRIDKLLKRSGRNVVVRFSTEEELLSFDVAQDPVIELSIRIAIKESVIKGIGGLAEKMTLKDIEVINVNGNWYVRYYGEVLKWMTSKHITATTVNVVYSKCYVISLLLLLNEPTNCFDSEYGTIQSS